MQAKPGQSAGVLTDVGRPRSHVIRFQTVGSGEHGDRLLAWALPVEAFNANTCLDDNTASEFVSGGLAKGSVPKVEKHLAGCRDCRDLVAALAVGDEDSQAATKPHHKIA